MSAFVNFIQGNHLTTIIHNDTYPAISPIKVDLNGKRVLIIDTFEEFGRVLAISFAKAGASSIIISSHSDSAVLENAMAHAARAAGKKVPRVLSIETRLNTVESTGNAAALVEATFGGIDILVYNTTIPDNAKLLTDGEPESWSDTWSISIQYLCRWIRVFLPMMLRGGDKQIVISTGTLGVQQYGLETCRTAKLARLQFLEFVMEKYGDQGVLPFCIFPGNIAASASSEQVPEDLMHGSFLLRREQ